MNNLKTILIDVEPLARDILRSLLNDYPQIEIIGEAKNGEDAVEKIESLLPDLIFLDIQMPGCDAFEVIRRFRHLKQQPVPVFQTVYDEFALKAFETMAVDFLLKPVDPERLKLTIEKLGAIKGDESSQSDKLDKLFAYLDSAEVKQSKDQQFLRIKAGDEIFFVRLEEICYLEADNKYTVVHTQNEEFLIKDTLGVLESSLGSQFVRVHRSFIINLKYLKKLKKWFKGSYVAVLNNKKQTEIPISSEMKGRLFE